MNQSQVLSTKEYRSGEAFLQRFFGNEMVVAESRQELVSAGIQLKRFEIIISPAQTEPEEMAYLHFYPVAENKYFLKLSFFPETISQEGVCKVIQLLFEPYFFDQWPDGLLHKQQPFRFDKSTEQSFTLNNSCRDLLDKLIKTRDRTKDFLDILQSQETAISLLRYALGAFIIPDEANKLPACSFLSNGTERDKVMHARKIIMDQLERPSTIRELSREVGMNECYLKKGFKAMFGKTIHEYQQYQRIEKSKTLLLQGDLSINEVAYRMGYGSASHFSTSFKKVAGMKPCELLR